MLHSIVGTLPLILQTLLAKCLLELRSSLLHENQAAVHKIIIYVKQQFTIANCLKDNSSNLLFYYFHHLMKQISLSYMHMDKIPTVLHNCFQKLKHSKQDEDLYVNPLRKRS